MKKSTELSQETSLSEAQIEELTADGLLPEYDIDYSKARPNRFAARLAQTRTVELEPDVAAVFTTQSAVNDALRTIIRSMPQTPHRETA